MLLDIQCSCRTGISTRPEADSACTAAIATSSASAYDRAMVASPMRKRLDSARMRQNPPRWIT